MLEMWVRSLDQEDPLDRARQPTLVFLPGKSHGQKSLLGYSPKGCKESDTTEWLSWLMVGGKWCGLALFCHLYCVLWGFLHACYDIDCLQGIRGCDIGSCYNWQCIQITFSALWTGQILVIWKSKGCPAIIYPEGHPRLVCWTHLPKVNLGAKPGKGSREQRGEDSCPWCQVSGE